MMKMIDMKRNYEEQKAVPAVSPLEGYPGGLCMYLCEGDIKKLGIEEMPEPGEILEIQAKVVVRSTSEHENLEMGETRDMSLQVVEMALKGAAKKKKESSAKDLAGKLYSNHTDDQEF